MADKQIQFRVVLNGAFLFVDDYGEPSLEVILPNIGAEHAYVAGNFLAEAALEQGKTFRLVGPKGNDGEAPETHFDHKRNFVFSEPVDLEKNPRGRIYSSLVLPRPDRIYSLSTSPTEGATFCFGKKGEKQRGFKLPQCGSGLQVFDYYEDFTGKLELKGHVWEPSLGRLKTGYPTLFVYADAATPVPMDNHRVRAFNAVVQLLSGVEFLMIQDTMGNCPPDSEDDPGRILSMAEKMGLLERFGSLAALGRFIRFGDKAGMITNILEGFGIGDQFQSRGCKPACTHGCVLEKCKRKRRK